MRDVTAKYSHLPKKILFPGELYVAFEPTLIKTILGSCISVCLYDPKRHFGAMCHGIMPSADAKNLTKAARFVDSSIEHMVNKLGGQPGKGKIKLEAKIFGGADMFSKKIIASINKSTIGRLNTDAARNALHRFRIPIVAEKIGGEKGCKIIFLSHTGEVFLQSLRANITR